jgi:hypothetical protein
MPLAASAVAFAADSASNGSEYMHQAAAGKWEVSPMLEYHDWTLKYNSNGNIFGFSKSEDTGMIYGVKGEYGINDMFSVGVNLAGESDTWKNTGTDGSTNNSTASGMNNIDIIGNGKYDLGGSTLRYGLDLSISMGSSKYDVSSGAAQGSFGTNTGGMDLTPFIGWETAMGPGILGAKFSYLFQLSKRNYNTTAGSVPLSEIPSSESGISAESLAVFYEWMQNSWSLGVSLAYNGVQGSSETFADGSSSKVDNGHAGLFVSVYAPITVADNITIIPNLGFGDNGEALVAENGGVNTWNGWDLSVAARFAF